MRLIFITRKHKTQVLKIKIFSILCVKMHFTKFVILDESSWRVKENRADSLSAFCQRQYPLVPTENYVYAEFRPRTAVDFMVRSEERYNQTRIFLNEQRLNQNPQTSFANAIVELSHSNNYTVLTPKSFDLEENLILNSTRNNFTIENIPILFNQEDRSNSSHITFQSISFDLQRQLSDISFKPHLGYIRTYAFNGSRGEGLYCATFEGSILCEQYLDGDEEQTNWYSEWDLERVNIWGSDEDRKFIYDLYEKRQETAPQFLCEKLQSCFSIDNLLLILYIINLSEKAFELVAYSLQPFFMALIGPQNFFAIYHEIFTRYIEPYIPSIFIDLLKYIETSKFGETLENIRNWLSTNEIVNSATLNSLVYRIQMFNTEKESGIRHVVISRGDSSKSFLTVLDESLCAEHFFPYFYSTVTASNSIEAMKVFEETVRYAGI